MISYHIERVKCPQCGKIQPAKVLHGFPCNIYSHCCKKCGYIIMENEWNKTDEKNNKKEGKKMINYIDCNNNKINDGDILRLANYEGSDSKNAPREPFLIFIQNDDGAKFYISGMDEYHSVEDYQTEKDKKENKISAVKLFAEKVVINANYTEKQPFDVCLTFDEIIKLHDIVRTHLIKRDYGFAPAMHIVFTPDKEFIEYQKVTTCCMHEITEAYNKAKESGEKIKNPHIDITDEMKAEMI